jgi:glutamate-ammonia-ligase adenylyltransferase
MTLGAALGSGANDIAAPVNGDSAATDDTVAGQIPLSGHSRFVQRLRRRYAGELPLLPAGTPGRASMQAAYDSLLGRGHPVPVALRVLRQLVLERLVVLDCDERAPLATVTSAMTELAEFALDAACVEAFRELDAVHGAPLTAEGGRAQLWVVGMGKLGARELNVSSDIDLVYVYETDGETAGTGDGRGRITNHEYFGKAVKAIFGIIGDVTEHGFVFRVDLALRPNGNSGPPAVSQGALEDVGGLERLRRLLRHEAGRRQPLQRLQRRARA